MYFDIKFAEWSTDNNFMVTFTQTNDYLGNDTHVRRIAYTNALMNTFWATLSYGITLLLTHYGLVTPYGHIHFGQY